MLEKCTEKAIIVLMLAVDPGEPPEPCKGVLSKLDASGQYAPIWSVTFQSSFGPSRAFVSDDGYVVALNDSSNRLEHWIHIYSRDWRNQQWNCKQVTIDLRTGKVSSN